MANRVQPMKMSKDGVEMVTVSANGHTSLSLEDDSLDQQCMKHSPPDPGFFEKGNVSNICTFFVMAAGLAMRFVMDTEWKDNVAVGRRVRARCPGTERLRAPREAHISATNTKKILSKNPVRVVSRRARRGSVTGPHHRQSHRETSHLWSLPDANATRNARMSCHASIDPSARVDTSSHSGCLASRAE